MEPKAVAAAIVACLLMAGCGNGTAVKRTDGDRAQEMGHRFLSDSGAYSFETVVDTKTGVTYLIWMNGSYRSGITVLLNSDGTPVISEEDV